MKLYKFYLTFFLILVSLYAGTSKSIKNYEDSSLLEIMVSFEYDEAIKYIDSILCNPLDRNTRIYYLCMQSYIARIINHFELSEKSALEALSYIDAYSPPDIVTFTKIELAFVSLFKNDFSLSFGDLPKGDEISNLDFKQKIAHLNGIYYSINGGYQESLPYLKLSFNQLLKTTQSHEQTIGALSIAVSYLGISKVDSALYYLDFAFKNSMESKDSLGLVKVLNTKATFNLILGNDKSEFLDNTKKAIEISEQCGFLYIKTICFVQLMQFYANLNDISNLLKYAKIAEKQFNGSHHLEINFYTILYDFYSNLNDTRKALFYLQKILLLKKDFEKQGQSAFIIKLNHEKKLKEQEVTIISQKNKIEQERNLRTQLIGINLFVLLTVLAFTIYFKKKKQNQELVFRKEKYAEELLLLEKSKSLPSSGPYSSQDYLEEDPENRTDLFKEFMHLIESEKLYLDPELKQSAVITKLVTNKKYFYEAISKNSNLNFKQIINNYRTQEAKKKIESFCLEMNSADISTDLFLSAGFNSISSYHRIFKEIVGLSPKEYAKEFLKAQKSGKPEIESEIQD